MNKKLAFENRTLLIVTKHHKDKVIKPLFEKHFELEIKTSTAFDTDLLGTFSGEVERKDNAINTLRKKCVLGMQAHQSDMAIATEGSFGSHPEVFFMPAHEEYMMFKDAINNLEIVEKSFVTDTNFAHKEIFNLNDLKLFALKIGFPEAGLILKFIDRNQIKIIKDIKSINELLDVYKAQKKFGQCLAESDMRAMNNPKRMQVIANLTKRLIEKINNLCPNCKTPGFGIKTSEKGLPCKLCNQGTSATLYHLLGCQKCDYVEKKMFPYDKKFQDPMYCDYCNP